MSYVKAELVLPKELLEIIQEYAQGQYLYIPIKAEHHKEWGENTDTKRQLSIRNKEIYEKYKQGYRAMYLAEKYYLSIKSIQRIVLTEKQKMNNLN